MCDCAANDMVQEMERLPLEEALNQRDLNLKTEHRMESWPAGCWGTDRHPAPECVQGGTASKPRGAGPLNGPTCVQG